MNITKKLSLLTILIVLFSIISFFVIADSNLGCCLNPASSSKLCRSDRSIPIEQVPGVYGPSSVCCPGSSTAYDPANPAYPNDKADCVANFATYDLNCMKGGAIIPECEFGCCCDSEDVLRYGVFQSQCSAITRDTGDFYPIDNTICTYGCTGAPEDTCLGKTKTDCINDGCQWTGSWAPEAHKQSKCASVCLAGSDPDDNKECYPDCGEGSISNYLAAEGLDKCNCENVERTTTDTNFCCDSGATYRIKDCSVVNNQPMASFRTNFQGVSRTVDFDAHDSSDPDGDSLTYKWNFNANEDDIIDETKTTSTTSHTFPADGTYTVSLIVYDGMVDSEPHSFEFSLPHYSDLRVTIREVDPNSGPPSFRVSFRGEATGGYKTTNHEYKNWHWDFDGETVDNADERSPNIQVHDFSAIGEYDVTLTVKDYRNIEAISEKIRISVIQEGAFSITSPKAEIAVDEVLEIRKHNAPDESIVWSKSVDDTIATLDNGIIMGMGPGTVIVTATASDGQKAQVTIRVTGEAQPPGTQPPVTEPPGTQPAVSGCIKGSDVTAKPTISGIQQDETGEKIIRIRVKSDIDEDPLPTKYHLYRCERNCPDNKYLVSTDSYESGFKTLTDNGILENYPQDGKNMEVSLDWDKTYTYYVSLFYQLGINPNDGIEVFSDPVSVTMGSEECKGKTQFPYYGCYRNIEGTVDTVVSCGPRSHPGNVITYGYNPDYDTCLDPADPQKQKSCNVGTSSCEDKATLCTGGNPFGLYYTSIGLDSFTFYDATKTTIDKCYSCTNIRHCYDYKSQDACTADSTTCEVAFGQCQWKPLAADTQLKQGVCIDTGEPNCEFCNRPASENAISENALAGSQNTIEAHNEVIDACTEEKATALSLTGEKICVFSQTTKEAISCKEATCYDYDSRTKCESDVCGLGVCSYNDGCFKNADQQNNGGSSDDDCYGAPIPENCRKDKTKPITKVELPSVVLKGNEELKINAFDPDCKRPEGTPCDIPTTYFCIDQSTDPSTHCNPIGAAGTKAPGILRLSGVGIEIPGEGITVSLGTLEPGLNYIRYYSVDAANNPEDVKFVAFYIDNTAPKIMIDLNKDGTKENIPTNTQFISGANIAYYTYTVTSSQTDIKITFETDEASVCGFELKASDGTTVGAPEPIPAASEKCYGMKYEKTYNGLSDGSSPYTWHVTCEDKVGNRKRYTYTIPLDNDPTISPIKLILENKPPYASGDVLNGKPTIEFTTPGDVECRMDAAATEFDRMTNPRLIFINRQESPNWRHTLDTASITDLIGLTGLYTFNIACAGGSTATASFTYDTGVTGNPAIQALTSDSSGAFNFDLPHISPANLLLKCMDNPRNSDNTDSIGYGCKIKYCEGAGCTPGNIPDADLQPVSGSVKDKQVTKSFSETTTIRYQAVEIGEGTKTSAIETKTITVDDQPPIFEVTLGKVDPAPEPAYRVEGTTPYITVGEGTYTLSISPNKALSSTLPQLTFEGLTDDKIELTGSAPWIFKVDITDGGTKATLKDNSDTILLENVPISGGAVSITMYGYDQALGHDDARSAPSGSQGNYGTKILIKKADYPNLKALSSLELTIDMTPPSAFRITPLAHPPEKHKGEASERVYYFKNEDLLFQIDKGSIGATEIKFYKADNTEITQFTSEADNKYKLSSADIPVAETAIYAKACDGLKNCVNSNSIKVQKDTAAPTVSERNPPPPDGGTLQRKAPQNNIFVVSLKLDGTGSPIKPDTIRLKLQKDGSTTFEEDQNEDGYVDIITKTENEDGTYTVSKTFTFTPAAGADPSVKYTATIEASDYSGNSLAATTWQFWIDPNVPAGSAWSFKKADDTPLLDSTPVIDKEKYQKTDSTYYLHLRDFKVRATFDTSDQITKYELIETDSSGANELATIIPEQALTGVIGATDITLAPDKIEDEKRYRLRVWAKKALTTGVYGNENLYSIDLVIDTTPLEITLNPFVHSPESVKQGGMEVIGRSDFPHEFEGTASYNSEVELLINLYSCGSVPTAAPATRTITLGASSATLPSESISDKDKVIFCNSLPSALKFIDPTGNLEPVGPKPECSKEYELRIPSGQLSATYTIQVKQSDNPGLPGDYTAEIPIGAPNSEYKITVDKENENIKCGSHTFDNSENNLYNVHARVRDKTGLWTGHVSSNQQIFIYDNQAPELAGAKVGTEDIVADTRLNAVPATISLKLRDDYGVKIAPENPEVTIQKQGEDPIPITLTPSDIACKDSDFASDVDCAANSNNVLVVFNTPSQLTVAADEGTKTITVSITANDSVDNQQTTTFDFIVDSRLPGIEETGWVFDPMLEPYGTEPTEYFLKQDNVDVTITFKEPVDDNVKVRIRGDNGEPPGNWNDGSEDGDHITGLTRTDSTHYSFGIEGLDQEQRHTITIQATHSVSKNTDDITYPLIVDLEDPVVNQIDGGGLTIPNPPAGTPTGSAILEIPPGHYKTSQENPTFTVTYTEKNPKTITVTLGEEPNQQEVEVQAEDLDSGAGKTAELKGLILTEGPPNEITITITDKAGKSKSYPLTVHLDITPPTISISADSPTNQNPYSVSVTTDSADKIDILINDEVTETLGTDIGDDDIVTGTNIVNDLSLDQGINKIKATAYDDLNNHQDSEEIPVIFDNEPPEITETIPQDGERLGNLQLVKIKLVDTGTQADLDNSEISVTPTECTKGKDGEYLTCTFAQPLRDTQTEDVKEYTVEITPKDILGNAPATPETFTFKIDKDAPAIDFTSPATSPYYTKEQSQTIEGTISAIAPDTLALSQYKINNEDYQDLTLDAENAFSIEQTLPGPTLPATYTTTRVTVKGTDNLNKYSEEYAELIYDPTPPDITITTTAATTGADTITIEGNYGENTGLEHVASVTAEVKYYDGTTDSPQVTRSSGTFIFTATLKVDTLTGQSDNIITVKIIDEAGNENTDEVIITKQAQLNAPILNTLPSLIGPDTGSITITGTSDLNTKVELYLNYVKKAEKDVPMGDVTGFETIAFSGTSVDKPLLSIVEGKKVKFKNDAAAEITISGLGSDITVSAESVSGEIALAPGTYNYNLLIGGTTITLGTITVTPKTNAFSFGSITLTSADCIINSNECHIYVTAKSTTEGVIAKESIKQIIIYDVEPPTLGAKTPSASQLIEVPPVVSATIQDNAGIDWNSVVVKIREGSGDDTTLIKDTDYTLTTSTISLNNPSALMTSPAEEEQKTYTLTIEADDLAENHMSETWQITIDKRTPIITAAAITEAAGTGPAYLYKPEHRISVTASEPVRCKYGIDNPDWSSMTQFAGFSSYTTSPFSDNLGIISPKNQAKKLYVVCEDETSYKTEAYQIDIIYTDKVPIFNLLPSGTIGGVDPQLIVETAIEADCLVKINDKLLGTWYDFDPHDNYHIHRIYPPGTWPITLTTGPQSFDVRCSDTVSGRLKRGEATIEFEIDLDAPLPPILDQPAETTVGNPVIIITGTAEASSEITVTVEHKDRTIEAFTGTAGDDGKFNIEVTLEEGTNTITATATDASGNQGGKSDPPIIIEYVKAVPSYSQITPAQGDISNTVEDIEVIWDSDKQIDSVSIKVKKTAEIGGTPIYPPTIISMTEPAVAGNKFTFTPPTPFDNGEYSVTVTATGTVGSVTKQTTFPETTFTVDDRVPEIKNIVITDLPSHRRTNKKQIKLSFSIESAEFPIIQWTVNDFEKTIPVSLDKTKLNVDDRQVNLLKENENNLVITATNQRGTTKRTLLPVILDTTGADAQITVE